MPAVERPGPSTRSASAAASPVRGAAAAAGRAKRPWEDDAAAGEDLQMQRKRTRVENGSPERARRVTLGGAAVEVEGSSPRGIGTRSGAVSGAPSPLSLAAAPEFDRRQLHDLPREVRRRLLDGAPLAANKPITGASLCCDPSLTA